MVGDDPFAKNLRKKYVTDDIIKFVENIENLDEM
jgi:hypothetical protein